MKKRIIGLMLTAAMTVSLLAGCQSGTTTETTKAPEGEQTTAAQTEGGETETTAAPAEEVTSGRAGEFHVALNYMPSSLKPSTSSDDQTSLTRPIFEPLFSETVDGFEYYLADSVDVSEDGLVYTIHINDKANWSDGEPVTSRDVVFSYEVASVNYPGYYTTLNGEEIKFEEKDEKTLVITLPSVSRNYTMTLARMYPYPSHFFNNDPTVVGSSEAWNSTDICTSGAYTIAEINEDSIVYTARSDYYRGTPKVTKIVMKTVGAAGTKQIAFENGEIDYIRVTTAEELDKYLADPDNYNVFSVSEARLNYLQLNPEGETMSQLSQDARKAIFLAINAEEVVDFAYGTDKLASTANSLITPDQAIYDENCAGYSYNLEEAKALAESSGLSGMTLKYIYNADRPNMEEVATVLQQQLKAIGVTLEVQGLESNTFFATFFKSWAGDNFSSWDLGTNGWDSERGLHAGQAAGYLKNSSTAAGYSDDIVAKVNAANGIADFDEFKAAWAEIQTDALNEYWEYPLTYTNFVMVSHKFVTGLDGSSVIPEFMNYLTIEVK